MNRPTPKEFAIKLLGFLMPAILLYFIFIFTFACKQVEPMYRVSGDVTTLEYINRKGDMIIIPLNTDECKGYAKPYHIIMYNN